MSKLSGIEEFQHVIIVAQFLRRRHFGAPHAQ